MTKSKRSPEEKAAVLAALMAGQSVSEVAAKYNLPKGTVSSWKNRDMQPVAHSAAVSATDATQKHRMIGDRLHELVLENLSGLIAVAKLLADTEWLKKQGAAELATLAGVTCDKTVRILEAMAGSPTAPAVEEAAPAPAPVIVATTATAVAHPAPAAS